MTHLVLINQTTYEILRRSTETLGALGNYYTRMKIRERSTCWLDTPGGSLSCLKSSRSLMHASKRSCGEAKTWLGAWLLKDYGN